MYGVQQFLGEIGIAVHMCIPIVLVKLVLGTILMAGKMSFSFANNYIDVCYARVLLHVHVLLKRYVYYRG